MRSEMPPIRLRYQKAIGKTLRPAFSLASHCTRKREKNKAWPAKPIPIHTIVGVMELDPPSCKPHHARQVDHAGPQPIVDPVLGLAALPRAMVDRQRADLATLLPNQRRQESVHVVELRQAQELGTAEYLDAAAGVAHAVLQE